MRDRILHLALIVEPPEAPLTAGPASGAVEFGVSDRWSLTLETSEEHAVITTLAAEPTANPSSRNDQLALEGADAFRRDGCLLLDGVLDAAFVERLHSSYYERHAESGSTGHPRRSLRVGHQRYMITIRLQPPFTESHLYGNPVLLRVLTELLGPERVLFSFGAVVSYPGAEDQHVHRDGAGLFGDPAAEGGLPPYAITAIVPLVEMNAETGTTRVWPGSHRLPDKELQGAELVDPLVRRGSVLLMDYRLHHGGLANRSTKPRPILSLVFTRPWFRDAVNFEAQPPLLYNSRERLEMPAELRQLLVPAIEERAEHGATSRARAFVANAKRRLRGS